MEKLNCSLVLDRQDQSFSEQPFQIYNLFVLVSLKRKPLQHKILTFLLILQFHILKNQRFFFFF